MRYGCGKKSQVKAKKQTVVRRPFGYHSSKLPASYQPPPGHAQPTWGCLPWGRGEMGGVEGRGGYTAGHSRLSIPHPPGGASQGPPGWSGLSPFRATSSGMCISRFLRSLSEKAASIMRDSWALFEEE